MAVHQKARDLCSSVRAISDNLKLGVRISISIGIAFAPKHGKNFNDIFRKADIALYEAKARGKNCYVIYSEEMKGKKGYGTDK